MTRAVTTVTSFAARLWRVDPLLTATGLVMLPVLAGALIGLVVDPRIITGAPAWLKPAKFAVSIAIYTFTLAWIFSYLPDWPRTRRIVGRVTAVVMVLEIAIISLQAWRGVTSHFNASTPLDMALFSVMGTAIVAQTLTSIAVAVALWRQPFRDAALGWALRLGLVITIVGASTGGFMTRPTAAQLEQVRATGQMPIAGAHTVGAPDGGPGLPGTGWSREYGDLRVPHFIGLHAVQALALIVFAMRNRPWPQTRRARTIVAIAASYAGLYVMLLWQALRGQSLVQPDGIMLAAVAAWAALTAGAVAYAGMTRGNGFAHSSGAAAHTP